MDRTYSSILVVDDLEDNRDLLSRRLTHAGYTVASASSGVEALDILEHERFDLILLDIMMPEMSGVEVLKRIRATPLIAETPVIMVSALRQREDVIECIRLGANDYISKPFDMLVLKSRVWRCLEGGSYCEVRPGEMQEDIKGSILIVDDNPVNIDLLSRRIEGQGHRFSIAENGVKALDLLARERFDLVLLDIHMPGMDGISVLKSMKADPCLDTIPVIMVSAEHAREVIHTCMELGADDFITKPFNAILLRSRIVPLLKIKMKSDLEAMHNEHLRSLARLGSAIKQ